MLFSPHLYVYNDLADFFNASTPFSKGNLLLQSLEALLMANKNVSLVDREFLISSLINKQKLDFAPFHLTLALGQSGGQIAEALHKKTGWFPKIQVVSIFRQELANGKYKIKQEPITLKRTTKRVAIIEDTIYSGLTMHSVLQSLPAAIRATSHIFCLQALTNSLPAIQKFCPISVGNEISGLQDQEVSVIKASGLFQPGAIRRTALPDMAFYEREEWMKEWFPKNSQAIISTCQQLDRLLSSSIYKLPTFTTPSNAEEKLSLAL